MLVRRPWGAGQLVLGHIAVGPPFTLLTRQSRPMSVIGISRQRLMPREKYCSSWEPSSLV